MSVWIPTARLEFRKETVTITEDGGSSYQHEALALYQRWTMRTDDGEVKFQWRPVPGQGMPLRQGPLELETLEKPSMEFDPSD